MEKILTRRPQGGQQEERRPERTSLLVVGGEFLVVDLDDGSKNGPA